MDEKMMKQLVEALKGTIKEEVAKATLGGSDVTLVAPRKVTDAETPEELLCEVLHLLNGSHGTHERDRTREMVDLLGQWFADARSDAATAATHDADKH